MHLHRGLGAAFEFHGLKKSLFLIHNLSSSRGLDLGIDQAVRFLRDKSVVNVVTQVIPLRRGLLPLLLYHCRERHPSLKFSLMVVCLIYDRRYLESRHTALPNLTWLVMLAWSRVVRRINYVGLDRSPLLLWLAAIHAFHSQLHHLFLSVFF